MLKPENTPFSYRAFGIGLRSFLPLPELLCAPVSEAALEIIEGCVPESLEAPEECGVRYQAAPGKLLLRVDGVARYLVEEGRRITVQILAGADEEAVRLFLLGSAFGAALHQRGDLVLHASAVVVGDQAAAFLGRSGVGKSTLAMELRRRGHAVLTDDLCVVRPDASGTLHAQPGFPQSKLWLDSLRALDMPAEGLRRIRAELEKRALPLGESFARESRPLRELFLLKQHPREEVWLEPVDGAAKFAELRNYTYRFRFVGGMGIRRAHLGRAAELARQATVVAVRRPAHHFRLKELADKIEAQW